jgi:MerR family transcriptional regulator, light-induced transcriptional regulator
LSHYSIKSIEQLSGIKAHTIRIWEQRYNFLKPKRTDTNIRYYDDDDLKKILNIALLNKHGLKISKIALLDDNAIQQEVLKIVDQDQSYSDQIQSLILSMLEYDEDRFEKAINSCILRVGFENSMINIIYPFLQKVGILWLTGSVCPAQEHFITNLIRQKLIVAIDSLYNNSRNSKHKFLLYLPEGELHELGLLFASYLIKSRGFKVVYLGQTLPFEDLKKAYDYHKPDYLVSMITSSPNEEDLDKYIRALSTTFHIPILLSGFKLVGTSISLPQEITLLKDSASFISFLETFSV